MKTVFKIATVAIALAASAAHADTVYWTPRALLGDPTFFGASQKVTYQQIDLSAADRARIETRLGYKLGKDRWTIFVATTGERVDGYAIFDEELGQHLPISFAVKISPAGVVQRQEIVAYREARGDEVRDEHFKQQFIGKTARDRLTAGDDIAVVSGATISSRAMAVGVRRALVLVEELVLRAQHATATARR
jgi:Na+-translocating ferredoxin:NAD+ oxidoreductase RnfG subunit